MNKFKYIGLELDLFATVHNWKSYWSQQIYKFVRGDVLEVGAGIGANTRILDRGGTGRWVCLEPDPELITQLVAELGKAPTERRYEAVCGTLQLIADQRFDTVVYIDVLEHIEDDREELTRATSLVRPGGHIIVLAPAHQRLFSPFDAAIGHFRRYDRSTLRNISPTGLRLVRLRYLDSIGLFASAANMLLLRQSMPTKTQITLWDGLIVPVSRVLDPLFKYTIGKSILAVWQKPSELDRLSHRQRS